MRSETSVERPGSAGSIDAVLGSFMRASWKRGGAAGTGRCFEVTILELSHRSRTTLCPFPFRTRPKTGRARPSACDQRRAPALFGESYPGLPVELSHLHLLDRGVVGWARVDLDPRQQHRKLEVFEVRRLTHHVLPRQIIPTLLEYLHQRLGRDIADHIQGIERIRL